MIPDPKLKEHEEMFYVITVPPQTEQDARSRWPLFYAQCSGRARNPFHAFMYGTEKEAIRNNRVNGTIKRVVVNYRTHTWYLVEDPFVKGGAW